MWDLEKALEKPFLGFGGFESRRGRVESGDETLKCFVVWWFWLMMLICEERILSLSQ